MLSNTFIPVSPEMFMTDLQLVNFLEENCYIGVFQALVISSVFKKFYILYWSIVD